MKPERPVLDFVSNLAGDAPTRPDRHLQRPRKSPRRHRSPAGPELAQAAPTGSTKVEPYALTAKDRAVHDAALVSTLKQLHDDIDAAVADAYGWPWPLIDAEILERVVALNTARAAEEARGHIRWLRPGYQIPLFSGTKQSALAHDETNPPAKSKTGKEQRFSKPPLAGSKHLPRSPKIPWPKPLAERVRAVETALAAEEKPATAADLAKRFTRANAADIAEILETLVTLGRAREGDTKNTFVR